MDIKDIKMGLRVCLVTTRHGTSESNPVWEVFKVGGTVDRISDGGGVGVAWDNGTHNGYSSIDLEPMPDSYEGVCDSIWGK